MSVVQKTEMKNKNDYLMEKNNYQNISEMSSQSSQDAGEKINYDSSDNEPILNDFKIGFLEYMFRKDFGGRDLKEFAKYLRDELKGHWHEKENKYIDEKEFLFLEEEFMNLEVFPDRYHEYDDISPYIYEFLEEEDPDYWVDIAKEEDPNFEGDEVERFDGLEKIKTWVLENAEFYHYILIEMLREINLERKQYKSIVTIQRAWNKCRWNPEYKMCEKVQLKNLEIETGMEL